MAKQTDIYKFVNPELTDAADITSTNVNWTTVENELKTLSLNITNNATLVEQLDSEIAEQLNDVNTTLVEQDAMIDKVRTELTESDNAIKTQLATEVAKLQPKITYGESAPSGGNDGDIYIQII